jgi:hypothetical protein
VIWNFNKRNTFFCDVTPCTFVSNYQVTWRHIQEERGVNISRREFHKSHGEGENFVSTRTRKKKKAGANT